MNYKKIFKINKKKKIYLFIIFIQFKKCKNKEGKRKDYIFFIYLLVFNWQFKKNRLIF